MIRATRLVQLSAVVGIGIVAAACGNKHYLAQYAFANHTIALQYLEPPETELLQGSYDISLIHDPIQGVTRAGGAIAKEAVARRARARLDSAADRMDVADFLAQRTLERASRYLGTRQVDSAETADYIIELSMRGFGLDARSSNATYMFANAEAVLIDRRTGREIWSTKVNGRDRVTPWVRGAGNVPSSIINAGTLSTVTVADFQRGLEELATFTSNLITEDLRDKLRDARDR